MEFSRLEYWSGYPFPSPGDLPNPGIELRSPALRADSLPAELPGKPKKTGVGSLSLLQGSSGPRNPTGVSILYQLSYQGSQKPGLISNHTMRASLGRKTLYLLLRIAKGQD